MCNHTGPKRQLPAFNYTSLMFVFSSAVFFYSDNFSNFYCLYFWSCCIPVLPYATTKLFKHRFFPPTRAWSGLVRRSYGCSLGQRERFKWEILNSTGCQRLCGSGGRAGHLPIESLDWLPAPHPWVRYYSLSGQDATIGVWMLDKKALGIDKSTAWMKTLWALSGQTE